MRLVPIECVKENSILAKDLYGYNDTILLKSGCTLTNELINKIRDLDIFLIYIVDDYTDSEVEDVIKPELRNKAIHTLKKTFSDIKQIVKIANKSNSNDMYSDYLESIDNIAEQLIDDILNNKNIQISLVDIKNMDNFTYAHCVNVAVISLVMGISLCLPKESLKSLCMGALIHDIGKTFLPSSILQKNGKLTSEEFSVIKKHPLLGFNFGKKFKSINSDILDIILQHHERFDGLGYPNKLSGSQINYLARIVSIADVYDALTSDRPYKRAFCPNDAVEYIMSHSGTLFDFQIVDIFSKIIVPYPSGTKVRLSNGSIAVVEKTYPYYPLRPTVKIIESDNNDLIGTSIKLKSSLSIVISNIIYE